MCLVQSISFVNSELRTALCTLHGEQIRQMWKTLAVNQRSILFRTRGN